MCENHFSTKLTFYRLSHFQFIGNITIFIITSTFAVVSMHLPCVDGRARAGVGRAAQFGQHGSAALLRHRHCFSDVARKEIYFEYFLH